MFSKSIELDLDENGEPQFQKKSIKWYGTWEQFKAGKATGPDGQEVYKVIVEIYSTLHKLLEF